MMTPEQREQMQQHISAIAQILYDDAEATGMNMENLAEIEHTVRCQLQRHVSPEVGLFLSTRVSDPMREQAES